MIIQKILAGPTELFVLMQWDIILLVLWLNLVGSTLYEWVGPTLSQSRACGISDHVGFGPWGLGILWATILLWVRHSDPYVIQLLLILDYYNHVGAEEYMNIFSRLFLFAPFVVLIRSRKSEQLLKNDHNSHYFVGSDPFVYPITANLRLL